MIYDSLFWRKFKERDILDVERLLRANEKTHVSACGRFLLRDQVDTDAWLLCGKIEGLCGLLVKSRTTVIPVFTKKIPNMYVNYSGSGFSSIPKIDFLKGYLKKKKIHSVQGLTKEVLVMEQEMKKIGGNTTEIFDYYLMSMDRQPNHEGYLSGPPNLVLRIPQLTDLDKIAPLQSAYEQEEVIPKSSVFSPAASRINIANIIAKGHVLAAELDGRIVGKININAVSYTRYQIGGVYVHPDFRGQGIARRMATEFTASLIAQNRGITLFVKKNNIAAVRLYAGLGFTATGDYRITYY